MSEEQQEQPQESLKDEIKKELKEEFLHLRHKRKRRVLYSVGIFVLGLVIGYGGGAATHADHHFGHGHFQNGYHMHK